jgi:hypothetical protein
LSFKKNLMFMFYRIKNLSLVKFIRNFWNFRKEIYRYEPWDYRFQLSMFRRSIDLESQYIEKYGIEVDEHRLKKVSKMKRVVEIMKWHENDSFIELAEIHLNKEVVSKWNFEKINDTTFNPISNKDLYELVQEISEEESKINNEIYALADKIEKDSWNELFEILKGKEYKKEDGDWDMWFDGSGLKGWWD